jgi:hypothetical protein
MATLVKNGSTKQVSSNSSTFQWHLLPVELRLRIVKDTLNMQFSPVRAHFSAADIQRLASVSVEWYVQVCKFLWRLFQVEEWGPTSPHFRRMEQRYQERYGSVYDWLDENELARCPITTAVQVQLYFTNSFPALLQRILSVPNVRRVQLNVNGIASACRLAPSSIWEEQRLCLDRALARFTPQQLHVSLLLSHFPCEEPLVLAWEYLSPLLPFVRVLKVRHEQPLLLHSLPFMTRLEYLHLRTYSSHSIGNLPRLPFLTRLFLHVRYLECDQFAQWMDALPNLKTLVLAGRFSFTPAVLALVTHITHLTLHHVRLIGCSAETVLFPNLTHLTFSLSCVDDTFLQSLCDARQKNKRNPLPNLQYVSFQRPFSVSPSTQTLCQFLRVFGEQIYYLEFVDVEYLDVKQICQTVLEYCPNVFSRGWLNCESDNEQELLLFTTNKEEMLQKIKEPMLKSSQVETAS